MKTIRLTLVFSLLSVTIGCAVNPVTGKQELALIPESQELAIGNEQYGPAQQSQGGLYTVDPDVGFYVQDVGQKLAAVSDRALPYEFVVLNDSTPNAWALPGGKIAVNRGLLTALGSEAELAAVLGHEIVHAAAKHGAQAMQRGLVLQGVVMASAVGAAVADSNYSNYIVGGAQLGAQLINQSYGRGAELESDFYGMQYMKRAGYNPAEAVTLQETFVELSGGRKTGWLDGLFASHPPSEERVAANRETAAQLGTSGETGADRYRQMLSRLIESKPAYDAFDQAEGMLAQGLTDDALTFVNRALALEPEEPRFYGLKGEVLLAKADYRAAQREFDKALVRDDGYFEYYLGRGLALAELNNREGARADLERSNQLLPTAIANARLGEIALASGQTTEAKQFFGAAMTASGTVGEQAKRAFVQLDFPERPEQYIGIRQTVTEREFIAQIGNTTTQPVAVQIRFDITRNGEALSRTLTLPRIEPQAGGDVDSGLRFEPGDMLTNASVTIVQARLLD